MEASATLDTLRTKFELLRPLMNERMRRQWAACEALSLKRGGVTLVARATGLSRTTIGQGMRELRERTHLRSRMRSVCRNFRNGPAGPAEAVIP